MRGKFNYPLFFGRILFEIGFLGVSVTLLVLSPRGLSAHNDPSGIIGAMVALCALLFYANLKCIRAIVTERFGLRIEPAAIVLIDHLKFKHVIVRPDEIKGFSISEYPMRGPSVKSIIFYLRDGKKIELPQFLFFNFKHLPPALEQIGITFLGEEGYRWKWVDSRYYKFDD